MEGGIKHKGEQGTVSGDGSRCFFVHESGYVAIYIAKIPRSIHVKK